MSRPPATDGALPKLDPRRTGWILAGIVAVAAGLRGYQLGGLSFWYDEVVTMRLARAGSPAALIDRLFRIDATRAPLHPLLLEGWVRVFGTSEAAARAFSGLCGVVTVLVVFDIGRAVADARTGLWAAWLTALGPALIVYSREARMYAWLVLVTCLCWRLLLDLRRSFTTGKAVAYVVGLAALVYSHPLGLPMLATLAVAGLVGPRGGFGSWRRWLAVHLAALALVAPWVPHYLDHPPEFLSGALSIRFLLGTPIGFTGGNFVTLGGLIGLIAWGVASCRVGSAHRCQASIGGQSPPYVLYVVLLLWLIVPPVLLYVYSRLFQPIFGPQRYTVYVAPAYLVLVALGLSRLPALLRYPVAIALTLLAALELGPRVYDPELKADWRGFANTLAARPAGPTLVIVVPSGDGRNVEVETARYYLPAGCEAIALDGAATDRLDGAPAEDIYLAVGSRRGVPAVPPPGRIGPYTFRPDRVYPGLTTLRAEHRSPRDGLGFRGHRACLCGATSLPAVGGGFEHRQHQAVEIAVEVRPRGAEGLLGGGPDAEAPLLELARDRAEPQGLDDREGPLDLGIRGQIAARVGPEIIGPDRRGPRSVRDPSPSRARTQKVVSTVAPPKSGAIVSPVTTAPMRPLAPTAWSFSASGSGRPWAPSGSSRRFSSENAIAGLRPGACWPGPGSGMTMSW